MALLALAVVVTALALFLSYQRTSEPESIRPDLETPGEERVRVWKSLLVLPMEGPDDEPALGWAFSAFLERNLAMAGGLRVVGPVEAGRLDRDLGRGREPLDLAALAEASAAAAVVSGTVSRASPGGTTLLCRLRVHFPEQGETLELPAFETTSTGFLSSAGFHAFPDTLRRALGPLPRHEEATSRAVDLDLSSSSALGAALKAWSRENLAKADRLLAEAREKSARESRWLDLLSARLSLERRDFAAVSEVAGEGAVVADLTPLMLEATGRWSEAAFSYAELRGQHPWDVESALAEARLHLALGQPRRSDRALEAASQALGDEEDPRIGLARAALAARAGDAAAALVAARQAADEARRRGDRRIQARALLEAAGAMAAGRDLEGASRLLERACALADGLRSTLSQAHCANSQAVLFALQGNEEEAEESFEAAFTAFDSAGDEGAAATVLLNRGRALRDWGRGEAARSSLRRGIEVCRRLGDRIGESRGWRVLAEMEQEEGKLEAAGVAFDRSLELLDGTQAVMERTATLLEAASLAVAQEEWNLALERLAAAAQGVSVNAESPRRRLLLRARRSEAEILLLQGRLDEARRSQEECLLLADHLDDSLAGARSRLALASLDLADFEVGRVGEQVVRRGIVSTEEAEAELTRLGDLGGAVLARLTRARARLAVGETLEAQTALAPIEVLQEAASDPSLRLSVALVDARVDSAGGEDSSLKRLEEIRRLSVDNGLPGLALEAELALAAGLLRTEDESARARLESLERRAVAGGYLLIAERARRLLRSGPGTAPKGRPITVK